MERVLEGQLDLFSFFGMEEGTKEIIEVIRDRDCTVDTPIIMGHPDKPVYGKGKKIAPKYRGRKDTKHFEKIYLPELLPLEEYDHIIILISGGKDSVACLVKLLELGVPKEKIELWHHDIDGGHPERTMDWKCTQAYMKALAEYFGIRLLVSYRVNGFFGELYRIGPSEKIEWIDPDTGEIHQCKPTKAYLEAERIKKEALPEMEELLKKYGCRLKFPAKSPDLSRRWCSAYLKIMVASSVIANLDALGKMEKMKNRDTKILIVSGERRGESTGRSRYNEMEIHRTNAVKKKRRLVHQWRPVIDYTEKDVWELLKRWHINPHPCYRIGWNRCSCAACIFSTPPLMAGFKEVYPIEFDQLRQDELNLGFTIDNKCCLDDYIAGAKSCFSPKDEKAVHSIKTGEFSSDDIYINDWQYPCGAFHGVEGGSC